MRKIRCHDRVLYHNHGKPNHGETGYVISTEQHGTIIGIQFDGALPSDSYVYKSVKNVHRVTNRNREAYVRACLAIGVEP